MKKLILSLLGIALFLFPLTSTGQWQAKMTSTISGGEQHYTVYSDMNKYRYEFNQDGMQGIVIVDPEKNITAILLPNEKMVHYTATNGMMSSMNDPVQAYENYKQYGEEKIEGTESAYGFQCIKKVLYQGEKKLFSQWFVEELNFPVYLEGHWADKTFMELQEIKDWEVDPGMFKVPEDYLEVDEEQRPVIPEPEPPESWDIKDLAVPVDLSMSRGMAVNVAIDETVYHKFQIVNTGDTPAKYVYHIFADGVELPDDVQAPEEYRTNRLYMEEDHKATMNWKAGWVILFKVYEGNLNLKIFKE